MFRLVLCLVFIILRAEANALRTGAVALIANKQSLTYVTTNLLVNYDGEANFSYPDGADFSMEFMCKATNKYHNKDTLRLEYYNAEGILLFETKPREKHSHIIRFVLKSNNDKYYLDCIRTAGDTEREHRYRTTFYKRKVHAEAVQHAVTLSVNGQILPTISNNAKSYDDYIFGYIDGEVLNVTCQKMDVNMTGSLTFYSDAIITSQTLRSPSGAVISLNISTLDIKKKPLICRITNADVEKPNARLSFISDVPEKDVRIRGLPRNNILYEYTNDLDQWTIEYQYSVNDILNLTCVSNVTNQRLHGRYENSFQWKFENNTFDSEAIGTSTPSIKFSKIPFTRILDATHNGTKIKCIFFPNGKCTNETIDVILRLKPESVLDAMRKDTSGENLRPMIVNIVVGIGVAAAVITMVCLVLWRQRTKRLNLIENAYNNLSHQNDTPIPAFPSQWEANYDDSNYAKIDEEVMQENDNYLTDNDKINRIPYKRQSNTSENHYTEIDDNFKPKPDGLAANWNTTQPSNYNNITRTDRIKATASHSSNNASCNNLPISNGNESYINVQKLSKRVTFRQTSNDLRPGGNYREGNSMHGGSINDHKVKPNNDNYYANTGQDITMQPGNMQKKPNYENNFLQKEKTDNPFDSDYAEPYDDLEISCKKDFYG